MARQKNDGDEPNVGHNGPEMDKEQIEGFIKELSDYARAAAERQGDFRSRLKSILDETGFHKGAFDFIRKIDGMSDSKRADFLRTFEPMFELMIGEWHARRRDMLELGEEDEG